MARSVEAVFEWDALPTPTPYPGRFIVIADPSTPVLRLEGSGWTWSDGGL